MDILAPATIISYKAPTSGDGLIFNASYGIIFIALRCGGRYKRLWVLIYTSLVTSFGVLLHLVSFTVLAKNGGATALPQPPVLPPLNIVTVIVLAGSLYLTPQIL